jgi:hypothetical protein
MRYYPPLSIIQKSFAALKPLFASVIHPLIPPIPPTFGNHWNFILFIVLPSLEYHRVGDHRVCSVLWLDSFMKQYDLKFLYFYSLMLVSFCHWIICQCLNAPQCVYPLIYSSIFKNCAFRKDQAKPYPWYLWPWPYLEKDPYRYDQVKARSLEWSLVSLRRKMPCGVRYIWRPPCDHRGRDWCACDPRSTKGQQPSAEVGKRHGKSLDSQRKHGPAEASVSDF